jgi:hypothetical protein
MILLDTNVLSALMRQTPDSQVIGWLDGQPRISVWTTGCRHHSYTSSSRRVPPFPKSSRASTWLGRKFSVQLAFAEKASPFTGTAFCKHRRARRFFSYQMCGEPVIVGSRGPQ